MEMSDLDEVFHEKIAMVNGHDNILWLMTEITNGWANWEIPVKVIAAFQRAGIVCRCDIDCHQATAVRHWHHQSKQREREFW
jgi:hypothetical protein